MDPWIVARWAVVLLIAVLAACAAVRVVAETWIAIRRSARRRDDAAASPAQRDTSVSSIEDQRR